MSHKQKDIGFITKGGRHRVIAASHGICHTKQSDAEECDINRIMRHYASTGLINHQSKTPPTYGDFTNSMEYQTACNALIRAEDEFMELPSSVRQRMGGDPGYLLDFLADPANYEESVRLKLRNEGDPPPPPKPAPEEPPQETPPPSGGE